MGKTAIIARHEFISTVRRKAFIILIVAFPVVVVLALLASEFVGGLAQPPTEEKRVGYVDETGLFTDSTSTGRVRLVSLGTREQARAALLDKEVEEYIIITKDYLNTGVIERYTTNREFETSGETQGTMRGFLLNNLLKGKASPDVIERVKSPLNVFSTVLTETGEVAPNQGGAAAFLVPYIFSLLLLMSIFFSSGYLLQGLGEEKENRVMEILLSSVSSKQLLAGKVLGLGAVGLFQMLVWLISARFLANIASSTWGDVIGTLQVPPVFLVLAVAYFILGYLLFAVLMAGVGAISPTAREGQQVSTLFTMPAVAPLMFMPFIIENPNHVVSQILTLFPMTAPITVMIRYALTDIPLWELVVSVLLLAVTIIACFLLCARVFRTFLLMYGKRPAVKDIMRSFKNA